MLCGIYLPCSDTPDRSVICNAILLELWSYIEQYPDCNHLIAGEINTNLDTNTDIASFIRLHDLSRCYNVFNSNAMYTYVNDALNQQSTVDYRLCFDVSKLK